MKPDYTKIGAHLRRRRKKLGMTQTQLAEKCDITEQYISNIERAISIPSIEVILRLAAELDTTPDEFLLGCVRCPGEDWKIVAEKLRPLDKRRLNLISRFIDWTLEQNP